MEFSYEKTDQTDLLKLLGGGSSAVRYLDAVEFHIARQLALNEIPDPTVAEQKDELNKIADKAGELSLLLSKMSLDAALILRIAFEDDHTFDAKHNRLINPRVYFSREPPYFPDDDVLSVFMKQLDLWANIASDQASYMKTAKGARRKTSRDIFVRQVVHQYHDTFGKWPTHGKSENFHSVVAKFCQLAGFNGEAGIEKLILKAKKEPLPQYNFLNSRK